MADNNRITAEGLRSAEGNPLPVLTENQWLQILEINPNIASLPVCDGYGITTIVDSEDGDGDIDVTDGVITFTLDKASTLITLGDEVELTFDEDKTGQFIVKGIAANGAVLTLKQIGGTDATDNTPAVALVFRQNNKLIQLRNQLLIQVLNAGNLTVSVSGVEALLTTIDAVIDGLKDNSDSLLLLFGELSGSETVFKKMSDMVTKLTALSTGLGIKGEGSDLITIIRALVSLFGSVGEGDTWNTIINRLEALFGEKGTGDTWTKTIRDILDALDTLSDIKTAVSPGITIISHETVNGVQDSDVSTDDSGGTFRISSVDDIWIKIGEGVTAAEDVDMLIPAGCVEYVKVPVGSVIAVIGGKASIAKVE